MKGAKAHRRLDGRSPTAIPDPRSRRDRHRERRDEELFGPVLQMIRVKDFRCRDRRGQQHPLRLAAGLVGASPDLYDRFWGSVRAGVINWNKPTTGAPSTAPFGGVGLSGNHRPSAFYAADYCAYPVTSSESSVLRANIGEGLRDPDKLET